MAEGFQISVAMDTITVFAEAFGLTFHKDHVGVTSFGYLTGPYWHEGVESENTPPILFGPHFKVQGLTGELLYPSGGSSIELAKYLPWFIEIHQSGWLRNASLPDCTDYPMEVWWRLWPSGRLCCKLSVKNDSGVSRFLLEEAYRLNPASDADMSLGRDAPPNLKWFGFYSNNTGEEAEDLSHDGVNVPLQAGLGYYGTEGNTNRMYRRLITWDDQETIEFEFLLALSVYESWGDCTNSGDFQLRGDGVSADVLNPDPLDGSANAGEVLVGTKVGDGYSEEYAAYTLGTQ